MSGRRSVALPRYLVAGALYLALSVGVWWQAWSRGLSTVMTCDCTDAGRMVWYFRWSAFALSHGHQLLYSDWLFHPVGLNLLSDTSAPAVTVALAPLTLLSGPVVAINVASTLVPAVGALTMFWLLQRWVRWAPAAFVGGLAYGFSAATIVQLSFGWLNLACTALLPLMVACFDELYVRQRARPARLGAALAVLVVVEFFVSTEMVLIVSVSAVVATVLMAAYAAVCRGDHLRPRLRYALTGLGVALALGAVLLAYPVWFFVAGPAHLGGTVWSTDVPGNLGNTITNLWSHIGQWGPISSRTLADAAPELGGYRGPASPSPSYLGPGLLVVLVAGTVVWHRDRRLWLFGSLGLITLALSLRVGSGRWGPWSVVYHLPFFDDVIQSRFAAVFGLCAAAMAAIIVDRSRSGVQAWYSRRQVSGEERGQRAGPVAMAAAAVVAAVALVPVVVALAPNLPLTLQPVTVPRWFETAATRLPPGQVLATYPFPTANSQAAIPWQAIGGMHFQMAGGGGPAGTVARAGTHRVAFGVLEAASVPLLATPALSAPNLAAVRGALHDWGVTMVVVPDGSGLPVFETGRGTGYGVSFFTAVLGDAPRYQDGTFVWSDLGRRPAPVVVTAPALAACVARPAGPSPADDPWAGCVLDSSVANP
jgi:dolichyl-phosphate beta-glucosyltransferase